MATINHTGVWFSPTLKEIEALHYIACGLNISRKSGYFVLKCALFLVCWMSTFARKSLHNETQYWSFYSVIRIYLIQKKGRILRLDRETPITILTGNSCNIQLHVIHCGLLLQLIPYRQIYIKFSVKMHSMSMNLLEQYYARNSAIHPFIYISIYLSIYLRLYSPCGLGRFFIFLIYTQSVESVCMKWIYKNISFIKLLIHPECFCFVIKNIRWSFHASWCWIYHFVQCKLK
jgi:hypothetical protein